MSVLLATDVEAAFFCLPLSLLEDLQDLVSAVIWALAVSSSSVPRQNEQRKKKFLIR